MAEAALPRGLIIISKVQPDLKLELRGQMSHEALSCRAWPTACFCTLHMGNQEKSNTFRAFQSVSEQSQRQV